jgi:hypothetical protein
VRVVVLGGTGNFGARICRALAGDPRIELVVAARDLQRTHRFAGELQARAAALDTAAADFAQRLERCEPGLVIHTAGPFQGQDYGVARAAARAGSHYIDLADGRRFVCDFAGALDSAFRGADRTAVSGRWQPLRGWSDPQPVRFARLRTRRGALCDIPDLELFPARYAGVQDVMFRAALEVGASQYGFAALAALRRLGLPLHSPRLARWLHEGGKLFDLLGTPDGGMVVRLRGTAAEGAPLQLAWNIFAPDHHGPEIPCMAAILLARRLAGGEALPPGAMPCTGLVALQEFLPEFARWGMSTDLVEEAPGGVP